MTKVLMDDSSLNAIANSIRRKNGLVRTYKPREMAPAIRAFAYNIPSAHDYTVTINQSEHQRIIVRKYLDPNLKEYTQSFTVAEPYYKIDISIEADAGWEAGTLNYQSPTTVDRDIIIQATPAVYKGDEEPWKTYYVTYNYDGWTGRSEFLTTPNNMEGGDARGVDSRYISESKVRLLPAVVMNKDLATTKGGCNSLPRVEELDISELNVTGRADLVGFVSNCSNLKKVDLSHLDTSSASSFVEFLSFDSQLRSFGDISHWDTSNLLRCSTMFGNDQYLTSIDLSGWETPILKYCSGMFGGLTLCTVIDISNWSTSQIESLFDLPPYLEYLIMDKEEIKFPNKIFGNNSRTKYLVPASMVDLYKEHANWKSRASQIDSIDNYTITRSGGQVFVKPNPY